ncbi:MAG: hypothetical protein AAF615_01845 [Pseudomonadota bacterium]
MTEPPAEAALAPDAFAIHEAMVTTFRFYIALTVFANLVYALVLGVFLYAVLTLPGPLAILLLIPPAMVSTGVAVLSGFGYGEALSLHRGIQSTGAALCLPHITHSGMLPVQTALTFIFHALISALIYPTVFFTLIGVFPALNAIAGPGAAPGG